LATLSAPANCPVIANEALGAVELISLPAVYTNYRQLLRYEKNGLESTFDTKKKHILKNN
jgi:hypothetical protein